MAKERLPLLLSRRFAPLFLTQFLGAFNDNGFKTALVILITYGLADAVEGQAQILVTLAAGLFILPFFLFSASAGQIADKYDKALVIRYTKLWEIVLMGLAALGFYLSDADFLLATLFLMGCQSAFFGPLKYGILPDHLRTEELIAGNALIESFTFVAILLGTLFGGTLVLADSGGVLVSCTLIGVAVTGWVSSLWIPPAPSADPRLPLRFNIVSATVNIVKSARQKRDVFLSILGISWFWLLGMVFLSQAPSYAKDNLGADYGVVNLFLTVFSLGIGLGSFACNRLLKGRIAANYVPLGALGMTVFTVDLYFATEAAAGANAGTLMDIASFLTFPKHWRLLADLLLIAACGGLYIVPLYAIVQHRSKHEERARTIAANNILNALFMVLASLVTMALLILNFTVTEVFLAAALANAAVALYICRLLPDTLIRSLVQGLLQLAYRVEVKGREHYRRGGDRVLIIANHTSFLDAVLLAVFLPDKPIFAINTRIAERSWVRPLLSLVDTFPLDPGNPMKSKTLIEAVRGRRKCMIFPEGRITVTGALMKVYEGPAMIADKAGATLLPIRIEGTQYTVFSRLKGKLRLRWFPKITLVILEPRGFVIPPGVRGRERRRILGHQLHEIMAEMMFESSEYRKTLFQALLDARGVHGGRHCIAEDASLNAITFRQLIARAFVLGRRVVQDTEPGQYIGMLLPNATSSLVLFFAFHACGRVPAILNYSTGVRNIVLACETARIRQVYSARRFIEAAALTEVVEALEAAGIRVLYLEDMAARISRREKFGGFLKSRFGAYFYGRSDPKRSPSNPAVVLFTSGSEGAPKGVVLSHINIQANRLQLSTRIDFGPSDIVLNALPMFHSFGLTAGTLLPVLSGIKTMIYPSPLHYRIIPEVAYQCGATIMFGTDTFLAGYGKHAHPYDFFSIRYVFAGAEKLRDGTRRLWAEKFGIGLFEGYGATETGPVLSTNSPMQYKPGSVGPFLPGISYRLAKVPGIEGGGRLYVSGPNVMLGYLLTDKPGVLVPPPGGEYDTGDIVAVDDDGFVTILGRAKRFAKIGGEMVSLTAVEEYLSQLWPGAQHAAVNLPDAAKGEQVILLTDHTRARRQEALVFAQKCGFSELFVPKRIQVVDAVPLLGSGKVDYQKAALLAAQAAN